jgi:hypothetical protein
MPVQCNIITNSFFLNAYVKCSNDECHLRIAYEYCDIAFVFNLFNASTMQHHTLLHCFYLSAYGKCRNAERYLSIEYEHLGHAHIHILLNLFYTIQMIQHPKEPQCPMPILNVI